MVFGFPQNGLPFSHQHTTPGNSGQPAGSPVQISRSEVISEFTPDYYLTVADAAIHCPDDPRPCIDLSVQQYLPHKLVIDPSGSVTNTSLHFPVVLILGDNARVLNHGSLSGGEITSGAWRDLWVIEAGPYQGQVLQNHGTITGQNGIRLGYDFRIINTGAMDLRQSAIWSEVTGDQLGAAAESRNLIENSGTISGLSSHAIFTNHGTDIIRNTGQINGDIRTGDNADRILNTGTINGWTNTGNGDDVVINFGQMDKTLLGNGNNLFISHAPAGTGTYVKGGLDQDRLIDGDADSQFLGGGGEDRLVGRGGNDRLNGEDGDDRIFGGAGIDSLQGGNGDDLLLGGDGGDYIEGEAGRDRMEGGDGDDRLTGGRDGDVMTGGAGSDSFRYTRVVHSENAPGQHDIIRDFETGVDTIELKNMRDASDARLSFSFLGQSDFSASGHAEIRYEVTAKGHSNLLLDVDGDGSADMRILLHHVTSLTADDFLF